LGQGIVSICHGLADIDGIKLYPAAFPNQGPVMKKRTRRAWTRTHVRTLKTLAKRKVRAERIAKDLKRTVGATRQKAFTLGLSLDSRV
jgi:hypothetical protein